MTMVTKLSEETDFVPVRALLAASLATIETGTLRYD